MSDRMEYELENVAATSVASDKIDETFRSSCIGKFNDNHRFVHLIPFFFSARELEIDKDKCNARLRVLSVLWLR